MQHVLRLMRLTDVAPLHCGVAVPSGFLFGLPQFRIDALPRAPSLPPARSSSSNVLPLVRT